MISSSPRTLLARSMAVFGGWCSVVLGRRFCPVFLLRGPAVASPRVSVREERAEGKVLPRPGSQKTPPGAAWAASVSAPLPTPQGKQRASQPPFNLSHLFHHGVHLSFTLGLSSLSEEKGHRLGFLGS